MLIAIVPLIVALVGLVMYVLATNPKVQEIGRIMFFCGLLVTLWVIGGHTVRIG